MAVKGHCSPRWSHPHGLLLLVTCIMTSFPSSAALRAPFSSIFSTHDQGYGYRNSFAKRTMVPTEDEGYGYRNSFAKRTMVPTEDEGYGYRNSFAKRTMVPTEDEGYGYRNSFAKRTMVPTDDEGYGYRNSFAKRTMVPTEDEGYGYRNSFAKRTIFPTHDQGYGYRNYFAKRTIFPTDNEGYGYRNSFAKRTIFPTDEEGRGYRDSFAKRVISIDDQGHGFRNYRSKRVFPSSDGYRDSYSKRTIIPIDDQGFGFRDYRAKRLSPDSGSVCSLCIMTYDPDYCIRCWWSKSSIVPIYAKKRGSGRDGSAQDDDWGEFASRLQGEDGDSAGLELPRMEEGRGANYSSVEGSSSGLLSGSQPLYRREQRSSACGCCYMSRLSNTQCCHMCQLSTKRAATTPELPVTSEEDESDIPSKRAYMINPDCFCCLRNGGDSCCTRCFAK